MGEAQSVINDTLGRPCQWVNSDTQEALTVNVVIRNEVELYENHQFAGVVTTGVFALVECSPLIGDTLYDTETDTEYSLDGIKTETPSKREFILGEV